MQQEQLARNLGIGHRLLYVAMTRAKRQLAISASSGNRFTRKLKGLEEVRVGA